MFRDIYSGTEAISSVDDEMKEWKVLAVNIHVSRF